MIKEALEFLAKLQTPQRVSFAQVGDVNYAINADGTLGDPVRELAPQWNKPAFVAHTLSGLKGLYEAKVDDFGSDVAIHIVDYMNVRLVSLKADAYGRRHVYAEVSHAHDALFKFGEFMAAEKFLIDLRTSFYFNENAVKIQQLCSNLESGTSVNIADDGVSQTIEAKAGTLSKNKVELPAEGIALIPWRSFRDANPVESKFLLRLKGVKDGLPLVALFEIDQKWKLDTIHSIENWLRENIPGATIIA